MDTKQGECTYEAGRPTVDFDHQSPEHGLQAHEEARWLREHCPVAWSSNHGGYWIVSTHAAINTVLHDHTTFTTRKTFDENGVPTGGITIPEMPFFLIPAETDPPEWHNFRRLLNPSFSPAGVERLRPRIAAYTTEMIDRFIERGEADLVMDLANPVPALITLEVLGFPLEEWPVLASPWHEIAYATPGSPEYLHAAEGLGDIMQRCAAEIAAHRRSPRDDLITSLIDARVDGEPLSDSDLMNIVVNLMGGGVDTTTALLSNAFFHLSDRPELREKLIADSTLLPLATEEFLRFYSPIQNDARTVTQDTTLCGQTLKEGERLLVAHHSANHDAAVFDQPDEFIIDRAPNHHVAFGQGIHRCIGSNLARAMFQIVITEVLRRLADYEVLDGAQRYQSIGEVNGWKTMPVRFTPGPKIGSGLDLAV